LAPGLEKENFEVYENGKRQQITEFAHIDIPVTVGLVVDASGSMRAKQPEVITAALGFIRASNPRDEIFVINFNEKPRRGLPEMLLFSDDLRELQAALWRGRPEGRTSLYDAIEMALKHLEFGRRDKKTLIVISDGGDNLSRHSVQDVMADVLKSAVTIYTIGISDESDPDRNPGFLKQIARLSGGGAYFPERIEQIAPICRDIALELRTRYTLGYVPPAGNTVAVRGVELVARSGSGQKLKATTRARYLFIPDELEGRSR
jgi:VWFA-related protein